MRRLTYARYSARKNVQGASGQDILLGKLYGTVLGRMLLSVLVRPSVSNIAGWMMDRKVSKIAIKPFVKKNAIDMSMCEKSDFDSYNDFFMRKLVDGARPISDVPGGFVSPCDSRLTVYSIEDSDRAVFNIKNSEYTLSELLRDRKLAERYKGGKLWLFRLCVDDYHRYIYNVDGIQSDVRRINGIYHTVNPIASKYYPIYKENTRQYCLIKTDDMGTVLVMEVGAMLVGRIENSHMHSCRVQRGSEKGNFAFGGSTIILLTQKDRVVPLYEIEQNSLRGIESKVRQGSLVGMKK